MSDDLWDHDCIGPKCQAEAEKRSQEAADANLKKIKKLINEREQIPSAKSKEGCMSFVVSMGILLVFMPGMLWVWVQFHKFINWLIECGW